MIYAPLPLLCSQSPLGLCQQKGQALHFWPFWVKKKKKEKDSILLYKQKISSPAFHHHHSSLPMATYSGRGPGIWILRHPSRLPVKARTAPQPPPAGALTLTCKLPGGVRVPTGVKWWCCQSAGKFSASEKPLSWSFLCAAPPAAREHSVSVWK